MPKVQLTENQHYVPQRYLDKFTFNGKHLFVFDKWDQQIYQSQPKAVANATFFYDFHADIRQEFEDSVACDKDKHDDVEIVTKALDRQLVEHALGPIESDFYRDRDELLRTVKEQGCIKLHQKEAIAYFMAIQISRTPEYRRNLIEKMNQLGTWLLHQYPSASDYVIRYDERRASLDQARLMFGPKSQHRSIQTLRNHIWTIGVNTTSFPFYTSDTPVVMKAHSGRYKEMGLGVPGIEIAFPFTSEYILILQEQSLAQELGMQDCAVRSLPIDRVKYYNQLQVRRSFRHVYSPSRDFTVAEQVCQRFPNICDPNRAQLETRTIRLNQHRSVGHFRSPDPDRVRFEVH